MLMHSYLSTLKLKIENLLKSSKACIFYGYRLFKFKLNNIYFISYKIPEWKITLHSYFQAVNQEL